MRALFAGVTLLGAAATSAGAQEGQPEYAVPIDLEEWGPDWSPDGRHLAFASINPADGERYLAELDLTSARVSYLYRNGTAVTRPRYSADGTRILLLAERFSDDLDIVVFDRATGRSKRLEIPGTDSLREDTPVWSSDQSAVYFNSVRDGDAADIYQFDLASGELTTVVGGPGNQRYPYPSPDGRKLIYRDDVDGDPELYVLDLASGTTTRLTDNEATDQGAVYSPDGNQIAYFSQRFDGDPEIVLSDERGEHPIRLTQSHDWDFMPVFSPDGSRIAFDSRRTGRRSIYLMDLDGGNVTQVGVNRPSTLITQISDLGAATAIAKYEDYRNAQGSSTKAPFLDAEGGVMVGRLLSEGELRGAFVVGELWLTSFPWKPARESGTGRALEQFRSHLEARVERNGSSRHLLMLGLAELRLEELDLARASFERVLELDANQPIAVEALRRLNVP